MKTVISVGAALILTAAFSLAQTTQTAPAPRDGGVYERLISIEIPSLPNAPFTASVHTEWTRVLPDGNTLIMKNHRAIGRDSAGRIFQERRWFAPDGDKRETNLTQIDISDPTTHDLYICVLQRLTCERRAFASPNMARVSTASTAKLPGIQDLGTQFINGIEALGHQQTMTVPAGAIGNDHPLVSKREYWYSPALGINLISKREDPRFGTQNFTVSDITHGEPDPKLFQLPPGLKIVDLRHAPVEQSGQAQP